MDPKIHGCPVILQTYVAVPDRPGNRGVFPGGPEVQEILVGGRGPCPGARGHLARWPNIATDTRKEDIRRVLVDPKLAVECPGMAWEWCGAPSQRCVAGSSTGDFHF